MKRLRRNLPFLRSVLKSANRRRRNALLRHANKDQINSVSELVLNTLKNNIPLPPRTMAKLRPFRRSLQTVGNRKTSLKKRRETLQKQKGGRLWNALNTVLMTCCPHG